MKLFVTAVCVALTSGLAHGSAGPITELAQLPEPSAAVMLVLGAFAVVIGLSGQRKKS